MLHDELDAHDAFKVCIGVDSAGGVDVHSHESGDSLSRRSVVRSFQEVLVQNVIHDYLRTVLSVSATFQ